MAAPIPSLQTPTDLPKTLGEPRVFVMPERYRGGASGLAITDPKKEDPKPVPVVARPPAPLPPKPQPPKPMAPSSHGASQGKVFMLVGVFVLLVLGVGGFFAFRTLSQPGVSTPVAPVGTTPTPITPTPTTPVVTEPVPSETSPFPNGTRPGIDTDTDGLSDLEERLLYASDPGLPDTDADGFLDGNEVFHGYNPVLPSPSTLAEIGLLKTYSVEAAPDELLYSIPYPTAWTVTPSVEDPRDVVFGLTTGETLTVSVEDKTDATQTVEAWYAAAAQTTPVRPSITKSGVKILQTEDGLTIYADRGVSVLIFHLDTGIKGTIDYLQTFKMILNGLALK